jgi:hypothetical protein
MRANAGRRIIWAFGANFPAIRRATTTTAVFGFEAFKKRSHAWIGIGWRLGMRQPGRQRDRDGQHDNHDLLVLAITKPPAGRCENPTSPSDFHYPQQQR